MLSPTTILGYCILAVLQLHRGVASRRISMHLDLVSRLFKTISPNRESMFFRATACERASLRQQKLKSWDP